MACKHVVVIDDDQELVDIFSDLLRSCGYVVEAFTRARSALEYLREQSRESDPSVGADTGLIFLDLDMPEVDGYEFLRIKEAEPRLASLPVVVLTARSRPVGLERHTVLVLEKPVPTATLLQYVREHCGDPAG